MCLITYLGVHFSVGVCVCPSLYISIYVMYRFIFVFGNVSLSVCCILEFTKLVDSVKVLYLIWEDSQDILSWI